MPRLEFIDETLRDAHQSLWATRMTTEMMVPIARTIDEAGYFIVNLAGGAVFDTCIKYLGEDPWERLRIMRQLIQKTPLMFITRGQNVWSWQVYADDVVALTVRTVARNGIRALMIFDSLNDTRNLALTIRVGKEEGLYVIGCVVYTLSPVHTDEYFVRKARELVQLGADAVMLKDPSGLLVPERIRTLIPAMREAMGGVPLVLHSHCMTGLAPMCYLEAIQLGVNMVHTAISPLSQGESLPATEYVAKHARRMGVDVRLDDNRLKEIADYFTGVAQREGKPLGRMVEYDPFHYEHQIPGGMISNLRSQLAEVGFQNRLPEVLEEIARVREELGYPIMVSPLSQYVGVQALLNVMEGERYRTVVDEIRKYALGYYGELAAPIEPNILDRIIGNEQPITVRPGELIEPMLEKIKAEQGPFSSDEELLLNIFYTRPTLEKFYASRRSGAAGLSARTPLAVLIKELAKRPQVKYVYIQKGNFRLVQAS
ncbi:pyruvate carboxylase subunit B [Desulfofundulus sp. TPOSR]|uniref:pyruvate carboxylase subunit B n=1 Tax=Desulfofundulus sp. TPOSR TaxID=2714340 RepID=UPI0014074E64|nr:pyruvate carboxylase subunit B [Desulfofundulus sp. TPOSR]NHM28758.1 pyruvate carboxylase subunit B [Desulfofundulus sp. TPOSR]